jgi:peptide/nickel transport system substrate-binding protein
MAVGAVRRLKSALVVVVAGLLGLTGCGAVSSASGRSPTTTAVATTTAPVRPTTTTVPRTSSLTVEPAIEGRLTDNFNPFDGSSTLSRMGVPSFVYEPLIEFNELQVDQYYPWLAESWAFSTSGQTITFNLRPGVTWDDGSQFTATDVAYTFNLVKANPGLGYGLPIVSAVATNAMTFTLTLSVPGYSLLYDIARVPIVKNGFSGNVPPRSYVDTRPDGTGPYYLAHPGDASPGRVVLTGRPHYWQAAEPAIGLLVFPAFSSQEAVVSALRAGAIDWAGNFMPEVGRQYVAKDEKDNHFWAPPVNCISLELNLSQFPLDRLPVRRAISAAIDRAAISQATEGGYAPPATTSTGLVVPMDSQYLTAATTGDIRGTADPAAVDRILQGAGYHRDGQGYWSDGAGRELGFTVQAVAGSPLGGAAALIARQLRAAGFATTALVSSAGRLAADLRAGNFTAAVLTSAAGPSPYYMYDNWVDPGRLVKGKAEGGDYVRLSRATDGAAAAAVAAALDQYTDFPSDSTEAAQALQALGRVVSEQVPVVPIMYGVAWAEYSTRHASGWPNAEDAYEAASPSAPYAEYTVLQLGPPSS